MAINVCSDQILLPTPAPCDDCEILKGRVEDLEDKVGDYVETNTTLTKQDKSTSTFQTVLKGNSLPNNLHLPTTEYVDTKSPQLVAGENITLTTLEDGRVRVTSSGGGGGDTYDLATMNVHDTNGTRTYQVAVGSGSVANMDVYTKNKVDELLSNNPIHDIQEFDSETSHVRVIRYKNRMYEAFMWYTANATLTTKSSFSGWYRNENRYTLTIPSGIQNKTITNVIGTIVTGYGGCFISPTQFKDTDINKVYYYAYSEREINGECYFNFHVCGIWDASMEIKDDEYES